MPAMERVSGAHVLKWLKEGIHGIGGIARVASVRLDHPLQAAAEAQRVCDALTLKAPLKALEEAGQWLNSIAQATALKAAERFELIDRLDAATRKAQARVADDYIASLEHDRDPDQHAWQVASDFALRLGEGYLACARQFGTSADALLEAKPLAPLLTARGMRALRQQLKWLSMRYGTPRAEIWGEFARFYSLAASVDAAATRTELYAGGHSQTCASDEFLRGMTFWSAMPGSLSPLEQDIVERLVLYLTPKFRLAAGHEEGYDYFFDMDGSRPPMRFVRSAPVTAGTRYFDVSAARQAVLSLHATISAAGNLPMEVEWGAAAESNLAMRVLKHLAVNWGKDLPPRASGRHKTGTSLQVLVGYESALATVTSSVLPAASGAKPVSGEVWVGEDSSVSGCGAMVPLGRGAHLRVGMLVALLPVADTPLCLGIIRRVRALDLQHHVGIQFISKSAMPIYLRSLAGARQGRNREGALLLAGKPSSNGHLHIVARRDLFSGREPVEALRVDTAPATAAVGTGEGDQNSESVVILAPGGVMESGTDFDWLRYKVTAPVA